MIIRIRLSASLFFRSWAIAHGHESRKEERPVDQELCIFAQLHFVTTVQQTERTQELSESQRGTVMGCHVCSQEVSSPAEPIATDSQT